MKNISKDHLARLREALSAAHHEKEKIQVGDTWRVRTMGHIIDLGPLYFKAGYFTLFNRFLWKLAPRSLLWREPRFCPFARSVAPESL